MKTTIAKIGSTLFLFFGLVNQVNAQEIVGAWKGKLLVQGMDISLMFNIKSSEEGIYTTTMDSPSQGATDIPMDTTTFSENTLTIQLKQAGIKYVATLEGSTLSGTFYQNGMELPMTLNKTIKTKPGNTDLPSTDEELEKLANYSPSNYKYSVEDYFARPKAGSFSFSPNGKYLSYKEKDENKKNHVYVKNLTTDEVVRVIEEKEELIRGFGWANDDRLIYVMDKGGNEDYHLFAVDVDGQNQKELTPFEGVKVNILNSLKEDKDHLIISMNKNNPQIFEPYKINIVNGELKQLYKNEDAANPIDGYVFDKEGNLRGFSKLRDGVNIDIYYSTDGENYKILKELSWKDSFAISSFNYASDYKHDAYVISNLDSDKTTIYLYDLKENKIMKTLFSNKNYDVSGMSLSRNRGYELDFFAYEGEKMNIIPVSKYYEKLHKRITEKFPEYNYSIADKTDDESKYLIFLQSDKLYGVYYSYDAKRNEFKLFYNLMPNLLEKDMAEMRPITFKSRDGITLHGYITLPKEALNGSKVPVIVNPHGGPQGIRDSWGFNPEAQLFARSGYATLQVNFMYVCVWTKC